MTFSTLNLDMHKQFKILSVENVDKLCLSQKGLNAQQYLFHKSFNHFFFFYLSQTEEMNNAMDGLNKYSTEDDINALALKHFDDQTLIQVNKIIISSMS